MKTNHFRSIPMKTQIRFSIVVAVLIGSPQLAAAIGPTAAEMGEARRWVAAKFEGTVEKQEKKTYGAEPFFSFVYGGQPSAQCLGQWKLERASKNLDAQRTQHTLSYTDPKTGLVVRCVGVAWTAYPTVEWTVYFKNEGKTDTPLLEAIQALDTVWQRGKEGEFVLHHHVGDNCTINSFTPLRTVLVPNASKKFAPVGGRPSNGEWPYYNLERPQQKDGIIIAIGWPGQWASQFTRDGGTGLRVVGGQELTHLKLHPGEEVRTPLMVLQFYQGDWLRAQNIWRRWILDHNFPKDHGKPLAPKVAGGSVVYYDFHCNQAGDIEFIHRFLDAKIPIDYWWMDAGWYPNTGNWWTVGTWEVDKKRFPGGIRAISDLCHARGLECLVWFEPERVMANTWLSNHHPEWLYGGPKVGSDCNLLNLGNPDARRWITDHIDRMLTEQGIDLYRQDFNMDPLAYWRSNDSLDRQGMNENLYVQGYLAFWDELRRRHPGMLIDSCASGGRRDDLETMRRAVPLLRSDYDMSPEGAQCQTYGFGLWLPYYCGSYHWKSTASPPDAYTFRSCTAPFLVLTCDVRSKTANYESLRKLLSQWRSVVDCCFGDFYPLLEYSTADDVWMAWQFDRPDLSAGLIQAFRRSNCPYVSARCKLCALEPDARYIVSDLDADGPREMTGRELMEKGLSITIPEKSGAALISYKKAKK
jgi:alpha-galactosidase